MPPASGTQRAAQNTTQRTDQRQRRHRGEGQWAHGHREPLNKTETIKKDDDGLNVYRRIVDIYSKEGFDSIDPADLRGRFRWYGLYTQRRPGIDGGKTAVLEPEELEDRYFMVRVRVPGGQLDLAQLRTIADLSRRFGRNVADITDRQNVQLHWIDIANVPDLWETLEGVGLSTTEACGDSPRNMLGCPVAGIGADEIIDGSSALAETHRRYVGDPAFSNLPRKYKTVVSGCGALCTTHEINDVAFVGVEAEQGAAEPTSEPEWSAGGSDAAREGERGGERDHKHRVAGFDLWVGGGLSTNPMLGSRLGAFVTRDQVPEVWAAVTSIFRDYGYRRLRGRARMKFLVADWGVEKFREVLEKEYLGYALPDGPAPAEPAGGRRDHVGVHRQHDGRYYVGFAPRVGRMPGDKLARIADIAEEHGSDRVRTTVEQKMIILDVAEDRVESLVDALEVEDLRVRPSTFRRQTMACTGIEFCKLAIVETKQRASDLIDELERRLPDFDQPLTVNLNGCPNSCVRIQTADIGLKGMLVRDGDGNQVEGFQVHLGGGLTHETGFGRKLRGLKVTSSELPDYIERVARNYDERRAPGEDFAAWVSRAEEGELR